MTIAFQNPIISKIKATTKVIKMPNIIFFIALPQVR
jgi:hypothetical protein